ncbi:tyrosine-type recombinase/integrase [Streptomyces sp. NPDC094438]|uniref:tyrosine-type recombinase/integrase n=1 Tax=Streptomyces sp. NPDC094438 TaxID=3366061 RepID=UPI003805EAAE
MKTPDGKPSTVSDTTRSTVFNSVRKVMREAMDTGKAEHLGLDREFITAGPFAGGDPRRARRSFPDEVARALADEVNLARLAAVFDPEDSGLRDAWEAIVLTGRRVNEVLKLRWDCIGRYGGLPMFWHDQTKVGNYDASIRIPERLLDVLAGRQQKTLDRFTSRHGRRPTSAEPAHLVLFPSKVGNPDGTTSLDYQWFHHQCRKWVADLDLRRPVPHQARHALAASLLMAGASLSHIRRYLGQISDRMAEHYVHLTQSDLEDGLQHVWVTGSGALLTGQSATALTREQAQAHAVDLTRRGTLAEGRLLHLPARRRRRRLPLESGLPQLRQVRPVGADLLYWRRKREQSRLLADSAPDDATADYLTRYFEPTARTIDSLEKALAGFGLLNDALALDLRKPQYYFHHVWSTAFRATDLADAGSDEQDEYSDTCTADDNDPEQDVA